MASPRSKGSESLEFEISVSAELPEFKRLSPHRSGGSPAKRYWTVAGGTRSGTGSSSSMPHQLSSPARSRACSIVSTITWASPFVTMGNTGIRLRPGHRSALPIARHGPDLEARSTPRRRRESARWDTAVGSYRRRRSGVRRAARAARPSFVCSIVGLPTSYGRPGDRKKRANQHALASLFAAYVDQLVRASCSREANQLCGCLIR